MSRKIPKGWTDYLPYGDKVEGTKLFPFKTPLKLEMQQGIPKVQRFTPACLMANRPKLRAVIDLTDTATPDRYYCPKDFIESNVEHLKLRISGGGLIPGLNKIKLFSDAVDEFMRKFSDDPDALIGVHCTHGLNRTGYFICMYMVTRMGLSPSEAIDNFQNARGYVMYRQNFLEEIMQPGRHTSGSQVPNYRDQNKTIQSIGNYCYENTWLVDRPNKKPFRGFTPTDIRNGGRQERKSHGDRKRRWHEEERNWREENQRSGFPRGADLERECPLIEGDQMREDFPHGAMPERGWDRGPPLHKNVRVEPLPFRSGPLPERPSTVGRFQTGPEFPRDREHLPIVPQFARNLRGDLPVEVDRFPMEGVHRGIPPQYPPGQRLEYPPGQRLEYPPGQRLDFPPARDIPQHRGPRGRGLGPPPFRRNLDGRIPFVGVQGRGDVTWTGNGSIGRGALHDDRKRPHVDESRRDPMEYRSPLDEDDFQVVSHRRRTSHRGGGQGGRR